MTDVQSRDRVVIRFAGDSGDGMQLTGDRFTADSVFSGNDFATLPLFPAEIRAPHGTIGGVSSFQVHIASIDIKTPGDVLDVLVAMNPAALRANLPDLARGGIIIADVADFNRRNLAKVGFTSDPLTDGSLADYQVHALDLSGLSMAAVAEFGLSRGDAVRTRNMFALGLLTWLFSRPVEPTQEFLSRRFGSKPDVRDANLAAFAAGHAYGETAELFAVRYEVAPANVPSGTYRQITGNKALALGLMAGAARAGLPLFLGAYPITPATDILGELATAKDHGVLTFQAEDEIAAIGAALGASYAGQLGATSTSGPGMALKSEMVGLAVMLELPLVIVDVQRGGPSTGLPTKTEQSDLLFAMFGRHGEAPVPVLAAQSPADCFDAAFEACRIALAYRTPVILLSDGYLGNGAEPWLVPDLTALPELEPSFVTEPNGPDGTFLPYLRDASGARPLAIPGTPGLQHRIGGLEKADVTGAISYDAANHARMVELRAAKVAAIEVPDLEVDDPDGADVLVVGWGSSWGPIAATARRLRLGGRRVATTHLRHLNPLPANTGEVLGAYRRVIVPEMNTGQLSLLLRARYLVDAESYTQVRGLPLVISDLEAALANAIDEEATR